MCPLSVRGRDDGNDLIFEPAISSTGCSHLYQIIFSFPPFFIKSYFILSTSKRATTPGDESCPISVSCSEMLQRTNMFLRVHVCVWKCSCGEWVLAGGVGTRGLQGDICAWIIVDFLFTHTHARARATADNRSHGGICVLSSSPFDSL